MNSCTLFYAKIGFNCRIWWIYRNCGPLLNLPVFSGKCDLCFSMEYFGDKYCGKFAYWPYLRYFRKRRYPESRNPFVFDRRNMWRFYNIFHLLERCLFVGSSAGMDSFRVLRFMQFLSGIAGCLCRKIDN